MQRPDVILIGSGLGSLVCGAILSKEGMGVLILEKNAAPGGNLQSFRRKGFRFETGVHYTGALEPGQALYRYWDYIGLTGRIETVKLDAEGFDRIGFPWGEFRFAQGFGPFVESLADQLPGTWNQLNEYRLQLERTVSAFPLFRPGIPETGSKLPFQSLQAKAVIGDIVGPAGVPAAEKLAAVLAGNNFLTGGLSSTPLHVHALISHSFISGACRIAGGGRRIAEALVAIIRDAGGSVLTKKEVRHILHRNDHFELQTADQDRFTARKVIAGIHPAVAAGMMEPGIMRRSTYTRLTGLPETPAPFVVHLGFRKDAFPVVNHNYYYHKGEPWDEHLATGPGWPAMFLFAPDHPAEEGSSLHTASLLTYMNTSETMRWSDTQTGNRGTDYEDFKKDRADRLLSLASERIPGLREAVAHIEVSTPLTWRDFNGTPDGSMYGILKDFRNPLTSQVNTRTKIPGFYFTGQNTGIHGLLGVTISSVLTCDELLGNSRLVKKFLHE